MGQKDFTQRDKKGRYVNGHIAWSKVNSDKMPRGENHPFYGKLHSLKSRKKISKALKESLTAKKHRKELHKNSIGRTPWNKGKKLHYLPPKSFKKGHKPSSKWKKIMQSKMIGSKNPSWRGGISPLFKTIRNLGETENWRKKVFAKDNWTCQQCFKKGVFLHVHHIKPFKEIFDEFLIQYSQFSPIEDRETLVRLAITHKPFWDIINGITYCKKCHLIKEGLYNEKIAKSVNS